MDVATKFFLLFTTYIKSNLTGLENIYIAKNGMIDVIPSTIW